MVLLQPLKTELVMRVLLRLAEDVVVFNTLKPQRRKDIQSALNTAVVTVVPFLILTLEENLQLYKLVRSIPGCSKLVRSVPKLLLLVKRKHLSPLHKLNQVQQTPTGIFKSLSRSFEFAN